MFSDYGSKLEMNKVKNDRDDITIDTSDIKKVIKKCVTNFLPINLTI